MRTVRKLKQSRKHVTRKHVARKHGARKHVARKHVARKHVARKHGTRKHGTRKHGTRKHGTRKHGTRKHRGGRGLFGKLNPEDKLQILWDRDLLGKSFNTPGLAYVKSLDSKETADIDPREFLVWLDEKVKKPNWNNRQDIFRLLRNYSSMIARNRNIAKDRGIASERYDINQRATFGNPQGMSTEQYGQMMYARS